MPSEPVSSSLVPRGMLGHVTSSSTEMAHQAFVTAAKRFSSGLDRAGEADGLIRNAASIRDIQALIENSKTKYENEKRFPKARKWLGRAALTIHHYSSVIDVFAQISPEYVSLVWGSMKLVVTAAQNHHDTISLITKALSQVGDALSRVELATELYPTERMRVAVEELYTNIFEFFSRAHRWYQEGWCRRLWHSISHPPKLQYKDVLDEITGSSDRIKELSHAGTQLEIREMNKKLSDIVATLVIHSNALIHTDERLTDLQVSSIMTFLSKNGIGDAMKAYQYNQLPSSGPLSRRGLTHGLTNSFWFSPKLDQWSSATESKVIFLKGNSAVQPIMREFCVRVIEQLREHQVPILWVLGGSEGLDVNSATSATPVDVLKELVLQAVRINKSAPSEREMTRMCTRFKTLVTEREWMQLLASVLRDIGSQCYIVIDMSTVNEDLQAIEKGFSWLNAFRGLFAELASSVSTVIVKVLVLDCGRGFGFRASQLSDIPMDLTIPVRKRQIPEKTLRRMELRQGSRGRIRGLKTLPMRCR